MTMGEEKVVKRDIILVTRVTTRMMIVMMMTR